MTTIVTTPKQALTPAFLKQPPNRKEIELFKKEFTTLLDRINAKEGEEFHKNLIKDFLNAVYYKDKHYINTKDRADLVIHNDNRTTSSVGVLIETKSPVNKAEMVCRDAINRVSTLNVKSFQELVLYYLRERKTGKNFELRYLIITNVYEWFVFDAQDFEKLFYQNKTLLNRFEQFRAGKLSGTTTDFFYKEIAAPEIEKVQNEIPFTYFNIRDYENIVRSSDKKDDKQLIALYHFLSPNFLLKIPFEQDANSLNTEFYAELLHILGLEEVKRGGQKFIERKKEGDRNSGSIIENAIERIEVKNKWDNVMDDAVGTGHVETRLIASLQFDVALDLAITWINRILFLKLLESQILKYHNGNRDYAFLSWNDTGGGRDAINRVSTYTDLDTLFFSVLARKEEERTESIKRKFEHVPYLNSSLFEMTDMENKTIGIDSLRDDIEMELYAKSVLAPSNSPKGGGQFPPFGGTKGGLPPLEYLLRFLDAYDFSSEGAEDIQEENKPLISASVLGLIFEKINGYKDGSFFTPSFITMYMCRETIGRAVIQKFVETRLIASLQSAQSINDLHNLIPQIGIERANEIFNQIRICDPAVGSGHFLVSALNEMIYLKSALGILTDKNGKSLWNYSVAVDNDELIIRNPDGDIFVYNPKNPESQRVQETFFHEKQTIIENCLFGVDINPNSVKICQLRLWIELLKHAYYLTPVETGRVETRLIASLQTLPNIDINIKCGNSLMSRFALDDKYLDNPALQQKLKQATKSYKEWVFLYKQCDDKAAKRQFTKNIETEKSFFYQLKNAKDADYQNLQKAKNELELHRQSFNFFETETDEWNSKTAELTEKVQQLETLYNEKIRGCFEWRFEFPEVLDEDGNFTGFDVVVGNPPYGIFNKKQNKKIALSTEENILRQIKKKYPEAVGGMVNAARIFYAFGFSICCKNGFVSMIIPFGILTDTTSANLRKHIFENYTLLKVDAFPERDNTKRRVFDEVKMSTAILVSKKEKTDKQFDLGISYEKAINTTRSILSPKELLQFSPDLAQIPLTDAQSFNLLLKIHGNSKCKLGTISQCLTGEVDMTLGKNALVTDNSSPILVKGVQVDRFILKTKQNEISQGIIEYVDLEKAKRVISSKKFSDIYKKRIALQGLTGVNEKRRLKATIVEGGVFLANSCNYILEKEEYKLEYILALLNSKLLNFVFKTLSTSSNVNGYEVDNLPFIKLSAEQQQPIIDLVDRILAAKKGDVGADTRGLEREIDGLVYGLYGVSEEEVKIIENR